VLEQRDEVAGVEEADHLVEALAVHGQARVPLLGQDAQDLLHGRADVDRHHRGARHHHVARHLLAEVEHGLDELARRAVGGRPHAGGVLGERALHLLEGRHGQRVAGGAAAERPPHRGGGARQRPEGAGERAGGDGQRQRDGLAVPRAERARGGGERERDEGGGEDRQRRRGERRGGHRARRRGAGEQAREERRQRVARAHHRRRFLAIGEQRRQRALPAARAGLGRQRLGAREPDGHQRRLEGGHGGARDEERRGGGGEGERVGRPFHHGRPYHPSMAPPAAS